MNFKITYLPERNLIFGGQNEEKNPRLGLKYFGPYRFTTEKETSDKVRLGIIGNKDTIEKVKEIIALIQKPIDSLETNKWLYPPYPGMSKDTKFNCSIELANSWQQTLLISEVEKIIKIVDTNERIGSAVGLYLSKIKNILDEDNVPDAILCCLPKDIEEFCGISERTRGAKVPKQTKLQRQIEEFKRKNQKFLTEWGVIPKLKEEKVLKGFDFRNALKGRLMGIKSPKPIQILRESTMDEVLNYEKGKRSKRQNPASFAWNFSTALFYKANGKPWRLAKLREDTCYVGISFYRDKLSYNKDIQTSMAQVFTHTGEGLILRGTEVYVDEKLREPHLTENQAEELLSDAIKRYIKKSGRNPVRVVIHKRTLFTEAEKRGFSKAIGEFKKDFVTISKRNLGIRFMRQGSYPILRGNIISLSRNEHLLFTSGYIPRIRTYPGHRIPQPLLINHIGDSEIKDISDEILGLTKLNWNTTAFSTYMPITLAFSGRVGQILSELEKGKPLQNHYKFYM